MLIPKNINLQTIWTRKQKKVTYCWNWKSEGHVTLE